MAILVEGLDYSIVHQFILVLFECPFRHNYLKQEKMQQTLSHSESDKSEQMYLYLGTLSTSVYRAGERKSEMAHVGESFDRRLNTEWGCTERRQ